MHFLLAGLILKLLLLFNLSILLKSLLTVSYLNFLYDKYHHELASLYESLLYQDLSIQNNVKCNPKSRMISNEIVYMQLREINVKSGIQVSTRDCEHVLTSYWILEAIKKNSHAMLDRNHGVHNHKAPQLFVLCQPKEFSLCIQHYNKSSISSHQHYSVIKDDDLEQTNISHFQLDFVLSDGELDPTSWIIMHVMSSIRERDIKAPAFGFFLIQSSTIIRENLSHQLNDKFNGSNSWLEYCKEEFTSMDINYVGPNTTHQIHRIRGNYLHSLPSEHLSLPTINDEIYFVYGSVLPSPRVTLITACSRPQKVVSHVLSSIRFEFVREWIIVHHLANNLNISIFSSIHNNYSIDHRIKSKITELFHPAEHGQFGNAERNQALNSISSQRLGWVYFLDDDNVVHPNLWVLMQQTAVSGVVLAAQEKCPSTDKRRIVQPQQCRVYWVETGMCFIDFQAIGSRHRWDLLRHEADGIFIQQVCESDPSKVLFVPLIASYHNGLLCNENEKPIEDSDNNGLYLNA